jgi:hypothetical protein
VTAGASSASPRDDPHRVQELDGLDVLDQEPARAGPQRGGLTPTRWTRRLRYAAFVCSLIFTVGTLPHGWVIMDI